MTSGVSSYHSTMYKKLRNIGIPFTGENIILYREVWVFLYL